VLHACRGRCSGLGVPLLALACGLGCWGKAKSRHASVAVPEAADAGVSGVPGDATGLAAETASIEEGLARLYSAKAPALTRVLALLEGQCIDGQELSLSNVPAAAPLAALIANGEIVPGASDRSPLVRALRERAAYPDALRCPSWSDVEFLARFIDQLDLEPSPPCAALPALTLDAQQALLADDIQRRPEGARPFTRYLGLAYASNAGVCGKQLDRERQALFEAVHLVSTRPDLVVPEAIEDSGLLYRIDVRDYGWGEVSIPIPNSQLLESVDAWRGLVYWSGYSALELAGPDADVLKRWTGATVPALPVSAFIHALQNPVYYQLIGVGQSLYDFAETQGVELENAAAGNSRRAGFRWSDTLNKRVTRVSGLPGFSWWLLEPWAEPDVFADPLAPYQGGLFIFWLPNGLPGFAVGNQDGWAMNEGPYSGWFDTSIAPTGAVIAGGCMSCHNTGILPVADQVRAQAASAEVLAQYPGNAELQRAARVDSERAEAALRSLGIPLDRPDPFAAVVMRGQFQALSLGEAAAELGITQAELEAVVPMLPSTPSTPLLLEDGTVDRWSFLANAQSVLCLLAPSLRNPPVNCPR
jgi:hypothetical protein